MGYDLHIHSTYSDGTLKPGQLIVKALERGLSGIALTDHDSVGGIPEALEATEAYGDACRHFTFIPGVELTTDYEETEVHILGYNFNYQDDRLVKKLDLIIAGRNERAKLILKKLNNHGISLSWEKVSSQTSGRFVGRSHIFKAMEDSGFVKKEQIRETFNYYLGKKGVAYIPHLEITTVEAIALINDTGGVSVLAHPGRMGDDGLIQRLVDYGLQGIEVYYPVHTREMEQRYLEFAVKYHLVVTGGSDYHGAFSSVKMGESQVAELSPEIMRASSRHL